jgi:hypothetical protein
VIQFDTAPEDAGETDESSPWEFGVLPLFPCGRNKVFLGISELDAPRSFVFSLERLHIRFRRRGTARELL